MNEVYFDDKRMMNLGKFYIFLTFIWTTAIASDLRLDSVNGDMIIPALDQWKLVRNMFGMPYVYFSPKTNGQRSNISFTATGVDIEINLSDMAKGKNDKTKKSYEKLKSDWARSVLARAVSFLPYRKWKNTHGHSVHEIGFEYIHEHKSYVEKSYYIDCRGQLVFVKSLRLKKNNDHQADFNNLVKGIDCRAR